MDREEPDGVGVLLLGDGLELAGADRLLLADEAHEALDVAAAQLLVRAREPGELAHVGVAPPPVPLGEDGQVVVVVGDDPLAELLQREAVRRRRRAARSAGGTRGRGAGPRPRDPAGSPRSNGRKSGRLGRRAAEEHERVVREADERRGEDGDERLVVVAVVQQAQVGEEVDDLLLAEVAAPGRAVGLQPGLAQLVLVVLGVRAGREQEDDLAGARLARVDQLP